jgi:plasmid stabilization system protein ParE
MADFLAERSPVAAAAFVADLFDRASVLADNPRIGHQFHGAPTDNVRVFYFDKTRVYYLVDDAKEEVIIMTVQRGRQNPLSLERALADGDE